MLVLIPPGIVLCAGVNLAIGAHHELVLDLCTVDLAVGIDCFSCLIARAEPQRGKLCRFCSVIAVGGFVRIYFNIFQTTRLRTTIVFFYMLYKTSWAVNQNIWLNRYIFYSELMLKICFLSEYFMTDGFVCTPFLSLCNTGAENGSSSQGTVGQSGPVAGSAGGVSKTSKGQGSAEKEEQAGNQKRARRQWESWSAEDKNSFFEGLYEVKPNRLSNVAQSSL